MFRHTRKKWMYSPQRDAKLWQSGLGLAGALTSGALLGIAGVSAAFAPGLGWTSEIATASRAVDPMMSNIGALKEAHVSNES